MSDNLEKEAVTSEAPKTGIGSLAAFIEDPKVGRHYSRMLSIGPKKLNSLAREFRRPWHKRGEGMSYEYALGILDNTNTKAGRMLRIALKAAFLNLQSRNKKAKEEEATIKSIRVDKALNFKRIKPRARGRADRYEKFHSHLTVEVAIP